MLRSSTSCLTFRAHIIESDSDGGGMMRDQKRAADMRALAEAKARRKAEADGEAGLCPPSC